MAIYPNISAYKLAVIEPESFAELSDVEILKSGNDLDFVAGNFAVVFKAKRNNKNYALKCFHSLIEDRKFRYDKISEFIANNPSEYFVNYKFMEDELWVNEDEYPVIWMDWVEGVTLGAKIKELCASYDTMGLVELRSQFMKMASWLRKSEFAHGDLKHDNIIVSKSGGLKLIDYDGAYVPDLNGRLATELGSRSYQHPKRKKTDFNSNLDDFSILIIYASFQLLIEGSIDYYHWHNSGGNIIIGSDDLAEWKNGYFDREMQVLGLGDLSDLISKSLERDTISMADLIDQIDFGPSFKKAEPLWFERYVIDGGKGLENLALYYRSFEMNISCISNRKNEFNHLLNNIYKAPNHDFKDLNRDQQEEEVLVSYDWANAVGIGTFAGYNQLMVIDIDGCRDFDFIISVLAKLGLPENYEWVVQSGSLNGYHIIVQSDEVLTVDENIVCNTYTPSEEFLGMFDKLELLYRTHIVLPPSVHRSGNRYRFVNDMLPTRKPSFVSGLFISSVVESYTNLIVEVGESYGVDSTESTDPESVNEFSNSNKTSQEFTNPKFLHRNLNVIIDVKCASYYKSLWTISQLSWYMISDLGEVLKKRSFLLDNFPSNDEMRWSILDQILPGYQPSLDEDAFTSMLNSDEKLSRSLKWQSEVVSQSIHVDKDVWLVVKEDYLTVLTELLADIQRSNVVITLDGKKAIGGLKHIFDYLYGFNPFLYKQKWELLDGSINWDSENKKYSYAKYSVPLTDSIHNMYLKTFDTNLNCANNSEVHISIIYKILVKMLETASQTEVKQVGSL